MRWGGGGAGNRCRGQGQWEDFLKNKEKKREEKQV